jgi:LmbE family N-acetylglucosaminyl deacetylase
MKRGIMTEIVGSARALGWSPPPKGFWSLVPESFGIGAEEPTIFSEVSDWVPRKLAAIACYRTQVGESHPLTQLDAATAKRLLGVEYFHRARLPSRGAALLESVCASSS